jgi:hypothetical protein
MLSLALRSERQEVIALFVLAARTVQSERGCIAGDTNYKHQGLVASVA